MGGQKFGRGFSSKVEIFEKSPKRQNFDFFRFSNLRKYSAFSEKMRVKNFNFFRPEKMQVRWEVSEKSVEIYTVFFTTFLLKIHHFYTRITEMQLLKIWKKGQGGNRGRDVGFWFEKIAIFFDFFSLFSQIYTRTTDIVLKITKIGVFRKHEKRRFGMRNWGFFEKSLSQL